MSDYSFALAKVLEWIRGAIELRINDVCTRRKSKRAAKALREEAIEAEAERKEKREAYIEEKKEDFEKRIADEKQARIQLAKDAGEETPSEKEEEEEQFDLEQNEQDFNDEYPEIEIPPEVIDDIDNDFSDELEPADDSEQYVSPRNGG